jgi:hypothetical protein
LRAIAKLRSEYRPQFDLTNLGQSELSCSANWKPKAIRRQPLPGYRLFLEVEIGGRMLLAFEPLPPFGQAVDCFVPSGTRGRVLSGTGPSCHREPKQGVTPCATKKIRALNLESNIESNFCERPRDVENLVREAADAFSSTAKKRRNLSRQAAPDAPQFPFGRRSGDRP